MKMNKTKFLQELYVATMYPLNSNDRYEITENTKLLNSITKKPPAVNRR